MTMALRLVALCGASAAWKAASHQTAALRSSHAASFVRSLKFKRVLRVCNAYPFAAKLDVFHGDSEELTKEPLDYKDCGEFTPNLEEGDKLEFKIGESSAGTFMVGELPANDAVLLLVIHRHDTLSTAVSFESHVFSNSASAQVAVLDAYRGRARSMPQVVEFDKFSKNVTRVEDLRYNSVVAVNEGLYTVQLRGDDGATKARDELVALPHESYLILRVGVEAERGQAYPQELIVYPRSDKKMLPSSAAPAGALLALVAATALAFL